MTQEIRFRNLEQFGFGPNVMKKIKICTECGQIARSGSVFCRACGVLLPRETLFSRYKRLHICCPKCDTVLTSDARYCPHCGMKTQSDADGK